MTAPVTTSRDLAATLVVYGAAGSGKTTVLHCIHDRVAADRRDSAVPLGSELGAAPLLDWLPLDLGVIGGRRARVNLYAIPDRRHADATRRLILGDAAGVLFAADSQASRLADNVAALERLGENLDIRAVDAGGVPLVMLYTKQDLPAELLLPRDALDRELNRTGAPSFACSALRGAGVLEALHAEIVMVMRRLSGRG
ncbi:MAG: hypothetical protein ACREL5_04115 [Gemmatimonadales bacterium]